jgi:hypothetical protein
VVYVAVWVVCVQRSFDVDERFFQLFDFNVVIVVSEYVLAYRIAWMVVEGVILECIENRLLVEYVVEGTDIMVAGVEACYQRCE